ncbi:thymidylate synthase [Glycomyces dulcitolivorans]|uniref:thymidylate synthase n=1 Tax=Glycomyces dulcitolivorans TaxID=2200759 RepID=UPI000DD42414|nr:thymidylate synthase [Glycomyces dulcitolivorans]
MKTFEASNIDELFASAVQATLDGRETSPRGMKTREILDVGMTLTNPRARLLSATPGRRLNPAFAAAEAVWVLSGSDDPWIYTYNQRLKHYTDNGVLLGAYGPRMRSWHGEVDQLRRVVEILKSDPDSRRATIQLYDPAKDAGGHKDVPCTLNMRFLVRDGALHMFTSMRGQDVWIGLPYDLHLYTVIHELVAGWLKVALGHLHHHVASLHLYEEHLEQAAALDAPGKSETMPGLRTPWSGFDDLLGDVREGVLTGHSGWDAIGQTMTSYRMWRSGERGQARSLAAAIDGPMGRALQGWYDQLDRSKDLATVRGER